MRAFTYAGDDMSANYKEHVAQGTVWQRCCRVEIMNTYGEQPFAVFNEERMMSAEGDLIRLGMVGGCRLDIVPDEQVVVLDPATNEPTGEVVTHARLYQLLYSAYIQTALERDAEESNG